MMNFGDLENLKPLVASLHQFAYNTNELFIMHKKADFSISVTATLIQPSLEYCNKMHEITEKLLVLSQWLKCKGSSYRGVIKLCLNHLDLSVGMC